MYSEGRVYESAPKLCSMVLDKASIRPFGSVTQFLGKVGQYIFIEIDEGDCTFRSISDSNQCFGSCTYDRAFFGKFVPPKAPIRCKISVKCFIAAFRNLRHVTSIELSFSKGVESTLLFKLFSQMGIVKKYKFCIEQCEILEAVFDTKTCLNKLVSTPQKLSRVLGHMHGSVEVAMEITRNHVRM